MHESVADIQWGPSSLQVWHFADGCLLSCLLSRAPSPIGWSIVFPRTSDAQRPALPPYATWLPVVGHGSREHHRRHQHHPAPSLCPIRFRAHRTAESFFFVSFHKSDRRTKGVHRIDRLNHHAQRAGIVRSTAETGDQRVRSQKRKPKSDMIFSQCPPRSSSSGRTHPASPKKTPQARLPLQASNQRHRPLPPTGRTTLPTLHHHVTRPRARYQHQQTTTHDIQPMAAIGSTDGQQHAPPAGARPSARFALLHLRETEIRYSPTPAGPYRVRTLQRSDAVRGGGTGMRDLGRAFFPARIFSCPPPAGLGAHKIRRDVLCAECVENLWCRLVSDRVLCAFSSFHCPPGVADEGRRATCF